MVAKAKQKIKEDASRSGHDAKAVKRSIAELQRELFRLFATEHQLQPFNNLLQTTWVQTDMPVGQTEQSVAWVHPTSSSFAGGGDTAAVPRARSL